MSSLKQTLLQTSGLLAALAATDSTNVSVVTTDTLVIGGGAGGAHAAVRLTDYGQDVILVERQPILGGAVDSFTDPTTGKTYDIGVGDFTDYGNVTGFFGRFNVPITTPSQSASSAAPRRVDFSTGQVLTNYTGPSTADVHAALQRYATAAEQYEDILVPGYWNFPNASDIPEDLLMNFGAFVEKYNISDALPTIFQIAGAMGRIVDKEVLPVMRAFPAQTARTVLGTQKSYVTVSGRNQDLYDAVARFLGNKVYYNTQAISSVRCDAGVAVTVQDINTGAQTIIQAKNLVLGIAPDASKFPIFDFDDQELSVFSKLQYTREHVFIASSPSLETNVSLANLPIQANDNSFTHYPDYNFTGSISRLAPGSNLFHTSVVGDNLLGPEDAKAKLNNDVQTLIGSHNLPASSQEQLDFQFVSDHGFMHGRVTADDYRAGFIQDLQALQGRRSTWYTGSLFAANWQTILWEYNEVLVPKIVGA
ncbi:hypothetical protein N8I77_010976 [Diaporthe amygdali]|uniref:Beta-cyclopiazonate dehydrogenase n=1 Tax=Phomopsis amygdali TaxID=1214568 RepID=A0AAD9S4M3_PHOAM|nr:hypothetical protein N8I77_010976 [Diaporthe amygdali]